MDNKPLIDENIKNLIIECAEKIGYKHTGKKVNRDKTLNIVKESDKIKKSMRVI